MIFGWRRRRQLKRTTKREAKRITPIVEEAEAAIDADFEAVKELIDGSGLVPPVCWPLDHGPLQISRGVLEPEQQYRVPAGSAAPFDPVGLHWKCSTCGHTQEMTPEQLRRYSRRRRD